MGFTKTSPNWRALPTAGRSRRTREASRRDGETAQCNLLIESLVTGCCCAMLFSAVLLKTYDDSLGASSLLLCHAPRGDTKGQIAPIHAVPIIGVWGSEEVGGHPSISTAARRDWLLRISRIGQCKPARCAGAGQRDDLLNRRRRQQQPSSRRRPRPSNRSSARPDMACHPSRPSTAHG